MVKNWLEDFKYWRLYWLQWPYNWRHAFRRIRARRKICRNCFYYTGACNHLDPEVVELLRKAIEEDRLGIRPLPRMKLPPRD